jgi:hypothetical protein
VETSMAPRISNHEARWCVMTSILERICAFRSGIPGSKVGRSVVQTTLTQNGTCVLHTGIPGGYRACPAVQLRSRKVCHFPLMTSLEV